MGDSLYMLLHMISLVISAILLGVSYKWPRFARLLFAILFLWASYINTTTAWSNPEDYLDYANFAVLPVYKNFINGFFELHIRPIVWSIAFGQLLIAVGLLLRRPFCDWGAWMAIIFLIAIAPLGVGSGFPTTLIMAWGILVVMRKSPGDYWWSPWLTKT